MIASFKSARLRIAYTLAILLIASGCNLQAVPPEPPTNTPAPPTATLPASTQRPIPTLAVTLTPLPTPTLTPVVSTIPQELVGQEGMIYVREAPDVLTAVNRTVGSSTPWTPIGRTADNQWLQVQFNDGVTGWIAHLPSDQVGDINSLPINGESQMSGNVALVKGDGQVLINDAGDNIIGDLASLAALRIDARTGDNAYLHGTDSEGRTGWVAASALTLTFTPESLAVREVTIAEGLLQPRVGAPLPDNVRLNGRVSLDSGGLRLRQFPSLDGTILLNLIAGTELLVRERTTDNAWLLVQLREGYLGWVSTSFVEMGDELATIPVNNNPENVPYFVPPTPEGGPSVTVIGGGARQIFVTGQQMGNRANIFTTVGDSLTDTPYFLRNLIYGYDLGEYGYLLPVINYFNADTGQGNAFDRRAISTRAGWSTFSVLEVRGEFAGLCEPSELPIECEYRLTKPSYAIIMIGTNDAPAFPGEQYRANMQRIIDISVQRGVVPILSTLPPRAQYNERIVEYNQVISQLATQYGIPVIDLYSALINLPNRGLDGDGVHLSIPPGAPAATLRFNAENLQYGTTMRNLTALQALEQVRRLVGY
jgi:uncharacterized protein YgiM (DUF1202 family)